MIVKPIKHFCLMFPPGESINEHGVTEDNFSLATRVIQMLHEGKSVALPNPWVIIPVPEASVIHLAEHRDLQEKP